MKKVVGLGSALVDILSKIESDELLHSLSLAKGSMQLIDHDFLHFLQERIDQHHLATGGSASNTISGLARLGISTGFIGKIGNDSIGDFFKEDALRQGVNPHLLTTDRRTGCCISLITPDGERTMTTHLGASCELDIKDLQIEVFKNYSLLHIEGYLVSNQPLIEKAVSMAKEAGLKVSIDLASFNVVDENREFLQKLISRYVDIVFANEEEALSFTGKEAGEAVSHIAELCEIAVVKIGRSGAYIHSKKDDVKVHVSATEANAIDTTGAGDLYASGFLYGVMSGYSLERCGRIGSIVAGNVVEVIGAKMDEERWNAIQEEIAKLT